MKRFIAIVGLLVSLVTSVHADEARNWITIANYANGSYVRYDANSFAFDNDVERGQQASALVNIVNKGGTVLAENASIVVDECRKHGGGTLYIAIPPIDGIQGTKWSYLSLDWKIGGDTLPDIIGTTLCATTISVQSK